MINYKKRLFLKRCFFLKAILSYIVKFIIKLHYIYIKNIEKNKKSHTHYHTNKINTLLTTISF